MIYAGTASILLLTNPSKSLIFLMLSCCRNFFLEANSDLGHSKCDWNLPIPYTRVFSEVLLLVLSFSQQLTPQTITSGINRSLSSARSLSSSARSLTSRPNSGDMITLVRDINRDFKINTGDTLERRHRDKGDKQVRDKQVRDKQVRDNSLIKSITSCHVCEILQYHVVSMATSLSALLQ